jgi:MFS family permease
VTSTEERGYGYGLLNATSNAGGVAGFLGAGVVTLFFGLGALVPFVLAVSLGSFSVVLLLVPDRPVPVRPSTRLSAAETRPVVAFSLAVSIRAIGSGAVATFYGYLAASLGANSFEVGLVAVAGLLTAALVSLPLGRWIDRRGEMRGIWYGTVLTLASYGIFLAATQWSETVPAQAVRNGGLSLLGPGMQTWVARVAPPDRRAECLGIFSLVNSTLWSVGPLVGAVAIALAGTFGLFAMAIGTTLVSLAVMEILYGEMGLRARLAGLRTGGGGAADP